MAQALATAEQISATSATDPLWVLRLLALIDGLLRLCPLDDAAGSARQSVTLAIDALLAGLRAAKA